jgi:hypothetical protein
MSRKKRKYKIGDIIEHWSIDDDFSNSRINHYMIVGYEYDATCTIKNCRTCPRENWMYVVRHVETGITDYFYVSHVDMRRWNSVSRKCKFGFRKVG